MTDGPDPKRVALIEGVWREKRDWISQKCVEFGGCSLVATSLPKMDFNRPNDPIGAPSLARLIFRPVLNDDGALSHIECEGVALTPHEPVERGRAIGEP